MIRNYFTIAKRQLKRHRFYALINIICLATGICFSLLIGSYVLDELWVNSKLKNLSAQYVVNSEWRQENMGEEITTLGPLAKTIRDEYPGLVNNYYRFDPVTNIVSVGDKHFRTLIYAGDTTLVSMYGLPLIHGNPQRAFRDNRSAVVTEDFALTFFGRTDIIDQNIYIQTPADGIKHEFSVTAVLGKLGRNSVTSFAGPAQVFLPMDANQYFQGGDKGDNWSNVFMVSLLELKKNVRPKDLDIAFNQVLEKYQPPFVKGNLRLSLIPLKSYHLKTDHGSIGNLLTILSAAAFFILFLAAVNFINISIGTASNRLKEIGLRKVFGGTRQELIVQFLTESYFLTIGSALLSLLGYELLRPIMGQVLNSNLEHFWQFGFGKIFVLLALVATTGFFAGIYPAFVLSKTSTSLAAKGKDDSVGSRFLLRKGLVTVQASLAIAIFVCTIHFSKQLSHIFTKDLGYNKDQIIIISSLPRQWDSAGILKMESHKSGLLQIAGIQSASLSYDIPDNNGGGYVNAYSENNGGQPLNMELIAADGDFQKVYGLQMKEGYFLNLPGDRYIPGRIVLNETAVQALGWNSAIGKSIRIGGQSGTLLTVVGVVRDFNLESVHKMIQPTIIAQLNEPFTRSYRYFSLKLDKQHLGTIMSAIQTQWKTIFPDAGFEYSFMDEKFHQIYQTEEQLRKAASIASALNFIIVFMGIFGVLAFTLNKRMREIAIRKVLGANETNIVMLFIREYGLILLIAHMIAFPLAYWVVEKWLQNYAYRITQTATYYLLAASLVFSSCFMLIVLQSLRAARMNPVKTLHSE